MVKARTKKSKKGKKKVAKTTKKKSTVARNKFGSIATSQAARIDAALSSTPTTLAKLIKKAKLTGTFSNHMKVLIKRGHVVKTSKGYKLKS